MALDAAVLALIAGELKETLTDARIDKIFEPTRDEVVLQLRTRSAGYRLLCSARSGSARIGLTEEKFENPDTPPSFCMLLRKYLTGGRLTDIRVIAGERIAFFDFQCTNEMADVVQLTLAAELMGRYSNLVLYSRDTGKVIDALKRVDFEDSEIRQLLPGLTYTLPPMPDRLLFWETGAVQLVDRAKSFSLPAADALMKASGGAGPVVLRECAFRAFGGAEMQADAMTQEEARRLQAEIEGIQRDHAAGGRPCLVKNQEGKPIEFSFTPLTQYLPGCTQEEYESFSALLDAYYSAKDRVLRLRQKSHALTKQVKNLRDRALRKAAARREELRESAASDQLRIYGELLSANLWAVKKGEKTAAVQNYYTGGTQLIPLDVRLSPAENAQKYFKEYKKKQTAARLLTGLIADSEREAAYLDTVLDEIERAEGERALLEIREELKSQGYLKYYKAREKRQKPADFLRYRSSDGFLILVGRNNLQNDRLTMKTARGKDLWFHTKEAPGSHTVVMSEGRDIPLRTQNEAAMLAVFHSSMRGGVKVPVDYTEVRNIRKTNDCKPGMVLYDHYETAYVTPDENELPKPE
ncbi:MAG: NFACT RNA binding domain-containing protein [Oscillospiraceae bacterium]|nr:NFACT RNA binding domain-containing protein [Oscillospiraceae bacterium]